MSYSLTELIFFIIIPVFIIAKKPEQLRNLEHETDSFGSLP